MTKDIYKLHVVERGKGRPVILIHGGFSTHRYWNDVAVLLEGKRRLLLPDLLGYGKSPKPRRAEYSLKQFVACLQHTFEQYDFSERPVLVGHSMGGLVALRWAAEQPELFSGLVLTSPMLYEPSGYHQQVASLMLEGKWLSNKALARMVTGIAGMASFVPTPVARLVRKLPRHVAEDATRQPFYVYRQLVKNTYFTPDALKDLQKLTIPIRIVLGDKDHMTNHAHEKLQHLCKSSKYCAIQTVPTAHQTPLDHPEVIADVISSV